MPELPEVETIRRSIKSFIVNKKITSVVVRQPKLRWQVTKDLSEKITNQNVFNVQRRGKYLLVNLYSDQVSNTILSGTLIIHLGMSGKLLALPKSHPISQHEHVTISFSDGFSLCYIDPRRFGALLWTNRDPYKHQLLKNLGPEPLSKNFNSEYLYKKILHRKTTIKQFIMNNIIVVGVGNIYANEALFFSGIRPDRLATNISREECLLLVFKIKQVLKNAIKKGGTTIKDFVSSNGQSGYFQNELKVYGRKNQKCFVCGEIIQEIRLGQRSTFFCAQCQK
jgi:formamidopyrimidine-DNA glycosylase